MFSQKRVLPIEEVRQPSGPRPTPTTPFGVRLEQLRDHLKYPSAAAFCRYLGVEPATYSAWLKGKGHPDIGTLTMIRAKTGVDLNFLIAGALPGSGKPQLRD